MPQRSGIPLIIHNYYHVVIAIISRIKLFSSKLNISLRLCCKGRGEHDRIESINILVAFEVKPNLLFYGGCLSARAACDAPNSSSL
jgi:hypothetical protein